jgi:hypothetical protein
MRGRCGTEGLAGTGAELGVLIQKKRRGFGCAFFECRNEQEPRNECVLNGKRST